MRTIMIILMILLLTACSGVIKPRETGVLSGTVSVGPLQPVVIEGQEPPPVPPEVYTSRAIDIFKGDGETLVKNVPFLENGTYRVELEVGEYVVRLAPTGIDYAAELPAVVTIRSGETTTLNLTIDTGIR